MDGCAASDPDDDGQGNVHHIVHEGTVARFQIDGTDLLLLVFPINFTINIQIVRFAIA